MEVDVDVRGLVAPGFEEVADVLRANVSERGETGAAVCAYHRGRLVLDVVVADYRTDTIQVLRSVTKGVVAIVANLLAQRGLLDLDAPVGSVWPEFAAGGKERTPIRWLFGHRAGLPFWERAPTLDDFLAWHPVADALAVQAPAWEPGAGHGYHALTYGHLTGEVIRRVAGRSVGQVVAEELAKPLGLDLWIGLPAERMDRVARLRQAPSRPPDGTPDPLAALLADPTSFASRAFSLTFLLPAESTAAFLGAEIPATNGVGDARSLARLYAATIGVVDGVRLLSEETVRRATVELSSGVDMVTGYETRYATGFQLPFPLRPFAGLDTACFGHYGMGGPLAFADPQSDLAFAFASVQSQYHAGADPRSRLLAEAARRCALGVR